MPLAGLQLEVCHSAGEFWRCHTVQFTGLWFACAELSLIFSLDCSETSVLSESEKRNSSDFVWFLVDFKFHSNFKRNTYFWNCFGTVHNSLHPPTLQKILLPFPVPSCPPGMCRSRVGGSVCCLGSRCRGWTPSSERASLFTDAETSRRFPYSLGR